MTSLVTTCCHTKYTYKLSHSDVDDNCHNVTPAFKSAAAAAALTCSGVYRQLKVVASFRSEEQALLQLRRILTDAGLCVVRRPMTSSDFRAASHMFSHDMFQKTM